MYDRLERLGRNLGDRDRDALAKDAQDKKLSSEKAEKDASLDKERRKLWQQLYDLVYSSGIITNASRELANFLNQRGGMGSIWKSTKIEGSAPYQVTYGADSEGSGGWDATRYLNYQGSLIYRTAGITDEDIRVGDESSNRYILDKSINRFRFERLFVGFCFYSDSPRKDFVSNCGNIYFSHEITASSEPLDLQSLPKYFLSERNSWASGKKHFDKLQICQRGYFDNEVEAEMTTLSSILRDPSVDSKLTTRIEGAFANFAAGAIKEFPRL